MSLLASIDPRALLARLGPLPGECEADADASAGALATIGTGVAERSAADGARSAAGLVMDVAGIGLGAVSRVLRVPPLAAELSALPAVVDAQPRLRRQVERVLGADLGDAALAATAAVAQGLGRRTFGLAVDGALRANQVLEARDRARCARLLPQIDAETQPEVASVCASERAAEQPAGAVDRYADRVAAASLAASAATLLAAQPRRALGMLCAGLPKAGRMGPEAFYTQVGRALARRGVLVAHARALRTGDRVDTVVIDAGALSTGRLIPLDLIALTPCDAAELWSVVHRLFDGHAATAVRTDGRWQIGPVDALALRGRHGVRAGKELGARGALAVLGVARGRELVAVVGLMPEPDPGIDAVVAAARRSGCRLVVAGRGPVELTRIADRVATSSVMATVRELQADGGVVALVSSTERGALVAADLGIGLSRAGQPVPWGAHLIASDVAGVAFALDVLGPARAVAHRSISLAIGGSSVGAATAMTGAPRHSVSRALVAVNSAAAAAIVGGTWSAVQLDHRPLAPPVDRTPWHALPIDVVVQRVRTHPGGLCTDEVTARRDPRDRTVTPSTGFLHAVVEELSNPLTPILAIGAGLSTAVGSVSDAAIVSAVGVLSALFGGAQRLVTDRAVGQLLARSAATARVLRDGAQTVVGAEDLVVGDVVELAAGDAVPADCRVLDALGLEADETSLTGESLPVAKRRDASPRAPVAERWSMLYEGTSIAAGTGRAIVVATGASTEAGRSLAVSRSAPVNTPGVERRLAALTRMAVPVALGSGALVVGSGALRGRPLDRTLATGVALSVAAVPEGLPFLVTAAQLASARRLSTRQALVKNPRTIEALGRAQVVCFDKTGTLTEGRIRLHLVSDGSDARPVRRLDAPQVAVLAAALRATPVAPAGEVLPHATDEAVAAGGREARVDCTDGAPGWSLRHALPFEATRGYHAALGETEAGPLLCVKGAPEVVLPRCRTTSAAGSCASPLLHDDRARLEHEVDGFARSGYRVLAVAQRRAPSGVALSEPDIDDLDFVGFVALADEIRPSAADAVARLAGAGVRLVMITGDHPSTAAAIAAELGLLDGGRVLTGAELDRLDETQLDAVVPNVAVFARATPAHKVAIVAAFQRAGMSVAMTGDGANDAAAIRLADVGIALGRRGTAAASAAADVVITDDRLETIIEAVVEGRAMWSSVRDALGILLGGNLGEIGFTLLTSLLTGASPLTARQLLLVNLLTDLAPAMALALRAPLVDAEQLLSEGPESSLGTALTRDITIRAVATASGATAAWTAARITGRDARARTVALAALVGTQLGQTALLARRDPVVLLTAAGTAALLVAIVQIPGLSGFFGCRPLGPAGWSIAVLASMAATAASFAASGLTARVA